MYNACVVGNLFIHNLKYTDSEILKLLEKYDMKYINVNIYY